MQTQRGNCSETIQGSLNWKEARKKVQFQVKSLEPMKSFRVNHRGAVQNQSACLQVAQSRARLREAVYSFCQLFVKSWVRTGTWMTSHIWLCRPQAKLFLVAWSHHSNKETQVLPAGGPSTLGARKHKTLNAFLKNLEHQNCGEQKVLLQRRVILVTIWCVFFQVISCALTFSPQIFTSICCMSTRRCRYIRRAWSRSRISYLLVDMVLVWLSCFSPVSVYDVS